MIITPHSVRVAAARLIAENAAIAAYCAEHFGRALQVFVACYGIDPPGEDDAPYAWIYVDGENELGNVGASTLEFVVEVGAVCGGLRPHYVEETTRTASQNGLWIGGISGEVEELRELVYQTIAGGHVGAMFNAASRAENSVAAFPLEYAALRMNVVTPEVLDALDVQAPTVPAAGTETASPQQEGDE